MNPVSYTHLDVYKRQSWHNPCSIISRGQFRPSTPVRMVTGIGAVMAWVLHSRHSIRANRNPSARGKNQRAIPAPAAVRRQDRKHRHTAHIGNEHAFCVHPRLPLKNEKPVERRYFCAPTRTQPASRGHDKGLRGQWPRSPATTRFRYASSRPVLGAAVEAHESALASHCLLYTSRCV